MENWKCLECGFSNYASRQECYHCQKKKGIDTSAQNSKENSSDNTIVINNQRVREGDWLCGTCQGINFSTRFILNFVFF
jgi:hypothetical protein